jgi:hypothetical protein
MFLQLLSHSFSISVLRRAKVRFAISLRYFPEKNASYKINKKLSEAKSQARRFWEEKVYCSYWESKHVSLVVQLIV